MKRSACAWLLVGCSLAAAPASAETVVYLDGATQLAFGRGTSSLWSGPATFDDASGYQREVHVTGDQLGVWVLGQVRFIEIGISSPAGAGLAPGTYAGVRTISATINNRSCSEQEGWFKIYESEFAADGSAVKLAIDGLHWCEHDQAPLFVAVRVNSTVPITRAEPYAIAGFLQHATQGETVTLDGLDSYSYTYSPLSYLWEQTEGPLVQLSAPNARFTTSSHRTCRWVGHRCDSG